jgi:hypothetical protein
MQMPAGGCLAPLQSAANTLSPKTHGDFSGCRARVVAGAAFRLMDKMTVQDAAYYFYCHR